jgi:hypothetical protein
MRLRLPAWLLRDVSDHCRFRFLLLYRSIRPPGPLLWVDCRVRRQRRRRRFDELDM